MSDPIELTEAERQTAYVALSPLLAAVALSRTQPDYALGPVVDAIVMAVNKVRAGDPVGTIRRTDTGIIALRIDGNGDYPWKAFSPHGNPVGGWTQTQVSEWPIVFSPAAP